VTGGPAVELHFFDVDSNTRIEINTSAFTDFDPVGIAATTPVSGPHYFVFQAGEVASPGAEPAVWAMEMPSGTPFKISQNLSDGIFPTGVITNLDLVSITADGSSVVFRSTYEYPDGNGGTRSPQAIQCHHFPTASHQAVSQSPQSGARQIVGYVVDPTSSRIAYVSHDFPDQRRYIFTHELTSGSPRALTPIGPQYEVAGPHYEFDPTGKRVVFVLASAAGSPEVWNANWQGTDILRMNLPDDLVSSEGRFGPTGDVYYKTVLTDPPFLTRLRRAQMLYSASGITGSVVGRNAVSAFPYPDSVIDFAISPDNAWTAYTTETTTGDQVLHLAATDGSIDVDLTPIGLRQPIRIGDYAFAADSSSLYSVIRAIGVKSLVQRTPLTGTVISTELFSIADSFGIELTAHGDHFVILSSNFGSDNHLISLRQGDTTLTRWVQESDLNSAVAKPFLEPDGCAIFYTRQLATKGEQVWRSRCGIQVFLPRLLPNLPLGNFFQLDFLPRMGMSYTLSYTDDLKDPQSFADLRELTPDDLPWTDFGQETNGLPPKGGRFFKVKVTPKPFSVITTQ
jgi:hypothetical protein